MREAEIIRSLSAPFAGEWGRLTRPFECDSEIVELGGRRYGLTVDEFTPEEDLFSSDDPAQLGSNLAVATLSDLLAAGCVPLFYMHVVSVPPDVQPRFLEELAVGIRSRLREAGCAFIGGDTGSAETWRYTGVALGEVPERGQLTRRLPGVAQDLWVTGALGDANLAALTGSPTPPFELRVREAALARRWATGCIDTSGGFLEAVWNLFEQSPGLKFRIDAGRLPLAKGLEALPRIAGAPRFAALLGGAGEYELLFATPADLDAAAAGDIEESGAVRVGTATPASARGVELSGPGGRAVIMDGPPPCPRGAGSVEAHVADVVRVSRKLFPWATE